MESVSASSCSSKGSASDTKVNNPRKIRTQAKESEQQRIFRNDDSLRITRGRRPSQALDERRDDHFAVSKPMWHPPPVPPPGCPQYYPHRVYYMSTSGAPASKWYQGSNPRHWHSQGSHQPNDRPTHVSTRLSWNTHRRRTEYARYQLASAPTRSGCGARSQKARNDILIQPVPASSKQYAKSNTHHISRVVFPQNIKVPMELSPSFNKNETERLTKRSKIVAIDQSASPPTKKSKITTADEGLDKLDLLCAATLDLGPLQENPTGCSCPKSRCIALYCDCFKAGRRCDPNTCSCLNCLNTVKESGPKGARSKVSVASAQC